MYYCQPQLTYIPKTITNRAIGVYVLALLMVGLAFSSHAMDWYFWLFGIVEVSVFFLFANSATKHWERVSPKTFMRNVFVVSLVIRMVFVFFSYWYNNLMCGNIYGYNDQDAQFYNGIAMDGAQWMRDGHWNLFDCFREKYLYGSGERHAVAFSDTGFPIYLSIVYLLTKDSLFLAELINCIWGAWTVVLIYKLAQRNFGEPTARMAAILCMLMPTLWYYCGTGLKEVWMVFLAMLFVERGDALLQTGKFSVGPIAGLIAIAFYLFMIRTALAITLVLALITALLFSSSRVIGWSRRIILIVVALIFIGTMLLQNTSISADVRGIVEIKGSEQQSNMEWRSTRKDAKGFANSFAKYAGAAVFAPLIFTIPFPTMVDTPGQDQQKMLHGANFNKNITSFLTILAMFMLLFSGDWRKHVLPIAVLCGYLVVLVFSNFAQSERFHQPILCLELMFAAYAIARFKQKKKYERWYNLWLFAMFVAAIGWNWFKLKGRGMI